MAFNKEKFADTARDRFKAATDFWHNWRTGARDDFAFVSGTQWLDADEAVLNVEKRPPITFNYSEKMVDAVVGAEVSNRQEVNYLPRNTTDAGLSELWNAAAKWARDECNAEDEESDAFRDMLICGMGWTQTRMSYDEDNDGKILIERIDPLEMRSDPAASKPGIGDRRYAWREWWIDEADAHREWPNAMFPEAQDTDATGAAVITTGNRYRDDDVSDENDLRRHAGQVQIRLYECVEREPVWRVATGAGVEEISAADFSDMQDAFDAAGIKYVKQYKRTYYQGFFAGETLLQAGPSPCQSGFTFQAITGKRDRNRNTWYGLTRVMKDPQRWANKWLSQILHIINSNAKGGIMAEINAFVDPTKAQEEWSKPDSVTLMNEGALSQNKVKEKQHGQFPAGLDKLMQFALGSLPMVTGINLEALGLANREQAGVLEAQRKQAAYGLLAPLFDALRRYRKNQGRVLLHFIHEYISDGRLIRIGGADNQQFLPLTKQKDAPEYSIIVDQSPNAPDVKDKTWETLTQLLPTMMKEGLPVPPDLLDYAPIPVALAQKWKQFIAQQPKLPPQVEQQLQQLQQEVGQLQQENASLKADTQVDMLTVQQKGAQIAQELDMKRKTALADIALKRDTAAADIQLQEWIAQQQHDLDMRTAARELALKQQQIENEAEIGRIAARSKPATTES